MSDSMVEQTASGTRDLREEQRSTVAEMVDAFCQKVGGTPEQLAEVAEIDPQRFTSYLGGTLADLSTREMETLSAVASRLERKLR